MPTIPLSVAIALLVTSVLGTLAGLLIALALLRHSALRLLLTFIEPFRRPSEPGDTHLIVPGIDGAARGLLQLVRAEGESDFVLLFLPKHGDSFMTVSEAEGAAGAWQEAELAYHHPVARRLAADGRPIELTGDDTDLSLPARTVVFPVLARGHLIGSVAVGPRPNGKAISPRGRRTIGAAIGQASAALENAQLYESLRRAFTDVEDAQRQLLTLQSVSVAAQITLRLDQVLEQIVQGVVDGLSFDLAVVYLADIDQHSIRMPVSAGINQPRGGGQEEMHFDETSATARAMIANEVLVTHDLSESILPSLISGGALRGSDVPVNATIANLPLAAKGRIIGGMALVTRRPALNLAEIESLQSFAAQAAATIENARLYGELERAYSDLRTAQEQLVRADRLRSLGLVAGGVAHDFNNILTAILTRAQLGQQQTRSAAVRETLRVIEQAALDGAGAARRIQSLAVPREERAAEMVDLSAVLEQALDLTRPMWSNAARARGVTISSVTSLLSDALVEGQPGELREIATNLILNATAAMPSGGTLTLRTERRDSDVWCTVEDTGTGMTDEVKRRIFDPFFTTKGAAGSGLGMSIVAAILERHGGKIEIESEPGKGTLVRFGLPASETSTGVRSVHRRRGKVRLRILVAGEDESARDSLALILGRVGHHVFPTGTAEETVSLLVDQEFDVIVADLGLGPHSGWEIAEAAKVLRPSAAVILTTAWMGDWDPLEMQQRGVDSILQKPYTVDQVLSCLEEALLRD